MAYNTVQLIGHYGNDELHACSAWTSTSRELTDEKRQRIPALLKHLADAGHHTPFEKSSLHFLVTCDIASHIHLLKHRVGVSLNAESARYKELKEDRFYLPGDWLGSEFESREDRATLDFWQSALESFSEQSNQLYHCCLAELTPILGRKRAKESARYFKTYNSQITCDVMFNWRSFHHFLQLRRHKDAQEEIFDIADMMLEDVKQIEGNPFQHTIAAFGY